MCAKMKISIPHNNNNNNYDLSPPLPAVPRSPSALSLHGLDHHQHHPHHHQQQQQQHNQHGDGDLPPFNEIPLTALNASTRRQLSMLLNAKKILRSEEGYERDWRGIAALSQQRNYCDEGTLSGDDAMCKVLQMWCRNNPETATFANLERFLGIIDRWDVSDDIHENLSEDAKAFDVKQKQKALAVGVEPDSATESQCRGDNDPNILTNDDVLCASKGLPLQRYDAFVLYADEDFLHASELTTKLESAEYNFKLCLKNRDLLFGVSFEHVAVTQLIEERCNRLIVILTESFLKSPEDKFLVNYTQALQIQDGTRKIIPLIYEDSVQIPRTLKIYTHLRYSIKSNSLYNFWDRLASSIRNVTVAAAHTESPTRDQHSTKLTRSTDACTTDTLRHLPTPPTDIPSISINGNAFVPADDPTNTDAAVPTKKERLKFNKRPSLRSSSGAKSSLSNGLLHRNAHSTSQLNAGYLDGNASISDLSTGSGCSETKKKKKGLTKLISKVKSKVFSRSSTNLPETA